MSTRRARSRWIVVATAVAVIAVAVLFAPIVSNGFCAHAPNAGQSFCSSWQTSVVGIRSNVWLWLGATAAVIAAGWLLARRTA